MTDASRPTSAVAVALGTTATVVYALPVYLVGAMAVQIGDELRFGAAGLGLAVGLFRFSAMSTFFLGRLADSLGAVRSIRYAAVMSAIVCAGIAATATSWSLLVAWLMFGGLALAIGEPAANRLLVQVVPPTRQGLAFGLKGTALPSASMFAGLSVPTIALTIGWRWSYAIMVALATGVVIASGRGRPRPSRSVGTSAARTRLGDRRRIVTLGFGFAFALAASSTVPAFYVITAVRSGSSAQFAGVTLAVASVAAIVTRLAFGVASDRLDTGHLQLCAGLVAVGSLGLVLMAVGQPLAMALGAIVALAGTWGFNAVFWYVLVRRYPEAPGQLTGTLLPGGLLGSTAGPAVFGLLAEVLTYPAAWTFAGSIGALGAAGLFIGSRGFDLSGPRRTDAGDR